MAIFVKINFWGLKSPPEVPVELKTCSIKCRTHVHHFEPQRFDRVDSGDQGRSKYGAIRGNMGQFLAIFWPSLTPTAHPVKSLWFKMVCTCVLHVVLHVLSSTSTSGGYFRPKSRFWQNLPFLAVFGQKFTPHLGVTWGILRRIQVNIDPCTCV